MFGTTLEKSHADSVGEVGVPQILNAPSPTVEAVHLRKIAATSGSVWSAKLLEPLEPSSSPYFGGLEAGIQQIPNVLSPNEWIGKNCKKPVAATPADMANALPCRMQRCSYQLRKCYGLSSGHQDQRL